MTTIYIRLLDEGTEVFRPTEAKVLAGNRFKVLPTPDYDPDDERWEFLPGSVVCSEKRKLGGDEVLIAVGLNYDGGRNDLSV